MKVLQFALAMPLIFLLSGCKTLVSDSKLKDSTGAWDNILKVICPSGDPNSFFMTEGDAKITDFDTSAIDTDGRVELDSSKANLVRIDVCMNGDIPELKQVVVGKTGEYMSFNTVAEMKVQGLSEALFDNDYKNLHIEGRWINSPSYGFILIGSKTKPSALLLRVNYTRDGVKPFLLTNAQVQAGPLEFVELSDRDPLGPKLEPGCNKPTDVNITKTYETLRINARGYKTKEIQLGSTPGNHFFDGHPDICEVTVTDNATQLGRNAGVPVTVKFGVDNYYYKSTHHNWSDVFWFKTPFAEYAFNIGNTAERPETTDPRFPAREKKYKFTYPSETIEN